MYPRKLRGRLIAEYLSGWVCSPKRFRAIFHASFFGVVSDRYLIVAVLVSGGLSLLHLSYMGGAPDFNVPIIDSFDYIRDAVAPSPGEPYFHSPLYVWVVAATFKLLGYNLLWVRLAQVVVNALTCVVLYSLGQRLFSRTAARIAAAVWAVYGPAIYYAAEVLNVSWILLLYLLALRLVISASDRNSTGRWVVAGIGTGAAAIARPDIIGFAVAVATAMLVSTRFGSSGKAIKAPLARCLAYVVAAAVPLLVVGMANHKKCGKFSVLPSNGGLVFYVGNNPDYMNTIGVRLEGWHKLVDLRFRDGQGALPRQDQSGYYYRKAFDFIRGNPSDYARCLLYKARTLVSGYELPETFDLYTHRKYSPILAALVWRLGSFGFPYSLLLCFAAVGAWVDRRRWRQVWWLWVMLAVLVASQLLYWNSSRYRMPIVTLFTLFASCGASWLWQQYSGRNRRSLVQGACTATLVLLLSSWPLHHFSKSYNFEAETYALVGSQLVGQGRAEEGLAFVAIARALNPSSHYVEYKLAQLLLSLGRLDEAVLRFDRAMELNPEYYPAAVEKGLALVNAGRWDEGFKSFSRALAINDQLFIPHYYMGQILAERRQWDLAIHHFTKALEANPRSHLTCNEIGVMWLQQGELRNAIRYFSRAVAINPDFDVGRENLNGAIRQMGKESAQGPKSPPAKLERSE